MENIKNVKELLNNLTLLRFVKKFSADRICENDDFSKKFNIKANENSISILDTTQSKLLVTNSEFTGEEYCKYNIKQLAELLDTIGTKEGELIIPKDSSLGEMICRVDRNLIVVCGLPKSDKPKK